MSEYFIIPFLSLCANYCIVLQCWRERHADTETFTKEVQCYENHFLKEPPAFLRMGAKGAHSLGILLAVLPTFHARSWLKSTSFTSMCDRSQVCHALRLAGAREQLRLPVAICFFFWKTLMQPKAHQYHKLIPYMQREFLKIQGTISVDSDTEVFFDAKRPVHKSEGKKIKYSYFCNNWS